MMIQFNTIHSVLQYNNMNNKSKNKTLITLLMLSVVTMMMLVTGGIIPVHAAPGDLLLTINNPTPTAYDLFGGTVATTSNGDLLVGALYDDTGASNAGSAYLFDRDDKSLLLTINNPTPAADDRFGGSVATTINGDLLIGAYSDDTGATDAGSAYLFDGALRGTTSIPLLTINNPTPAVNDYFGISVATTSNGDLLVGAYLDNTNATDAGSAYLFNGTDGTLLLTINNPTPAVNDQFGYFVATTSNGDILISAYLDDTGATDAGSAYLFDGALRGTTSTPLLTINNPTPASTDDFGGTVATTSNGDLLIGAIYDDTGATDAGSAYLFNGTLRGTTSTPLLTINNPTPAADDRFGGSVATSNGDLLIGTYYDDTGATDTGSAYLFVGISTFTWINGGNGEIYYDDGNVGIGTSTPQAELHVIGSAAFGAYTTASGDNSAAFGYDTTANNYESTTFGYGTTANGERSTAFGWYTTAQPFASVVLGQYNEISGTTDSWVDTDPLFVIGNGANSTSTNNAVTVLKNGNVGIGTASPGENLEIEVTDSSDPAITFDSNGNEFTIGIDSSDSDKFKISDNTALGTNDRFVIDSTGNIGIGTHTPDEKIGVIGSVYINKENAGFVVDAANYKRVGFMKYGGYEAGIWRAQNQNFEIGRTDGADVTDSTPQYVDLHIDGSGNVEVTNGYFELATSSGTPLSSDCNASDEYGRMKVDSTASSSNLYVCTPSGWATK